MVSAVHTVAVVDDDEAVRRALRRLVTSLSYQPLTFASGEAFLTSLAQSVPGCVLLDLHMPGLDGMDVLRRLQVTDIQVSAIVITGFDQDGMREKCLAAGASGYLVKPLDRSSVAAAIEASLAN